MSIRRDARVLAFTHDVQARGEDEFGGLEEGEEVGGERGSGSGLPWEGSDRDYTYEELLGALPCCSSGCLHSALARQLAVQLHMRHEAPEGLQHTRACTTRRLRCALPPGTRLLLQTACLASSRRTTPS